MQTMEIYKAINDVSIKVNEMTQKLDSLFNTRVDENANNIHSNASDISNNRNGLIDTFETCANNANDILDLRRAIEEIYETMLTTDTTEGE